MKLTAEQARAIIEAHDIVLDGSLETDLLLVQNPILYDAYEVLLQIAQSDKER